MNLRDNKTRIGIVALVVIILVIVVLWRKRPETMREVGLRLGSGVAQVFDSSDSGSEARLIILEETHESRLQQIEQAIILTRAYRDDGLRKIVLEGYCKDKPQINWQQLRGLSDPSTRALVAIKQLELGLIGSGEFAGLVFDDVQLIACETSSEYIDHAKNTINLVVNTTLQVGAAMLSQPDHVKFQVLEKRLQVDDEKVFLSALSDIGDLFEKESKPASNCLKIFAQPMKHSIEQKIEVMQALRSLVNKSDAPEELKHAIDDYEAFLTARSRATTTMINSLPKGESALTGIIIGGAHAAKTMEETKAKFPFVVLAGDSYSDRNHPSAMTPDDYNSRMLGEPLIGDGVSKEIFHALGEAKKHPPGLTFDLYRAENELDNILFLALAGGSGGQGPPSPPYGHEWLKGDAGWRGQFWEVRPESIVWVNEKGAIVAEYNDAKNKKWNATTRMPEGATAMAFDVRLLGKNLVYTAKVRAAVENQPLRETIEQFRSDLANTVESELLKARLRLQNNEKNYATKNIESELFQRRPVWNVDAIIGKDRANVMTANYL